LAESSGLLELASIGALPQPANPSTVDSGELAVEARTPSNQTETEIASRSGERTEKSLVQEFAQEAQDNLLNWALGAGLVEAKEFSSTNISQSETIQNPDLQETNRPLAFVSEAMGIEPTLGSGLLEALALGGGALYAFNRFSGGKVSKWVRRLLPATAAGFYAGAARYERVVTVFLMESERGLQRVVAAKVSDEKLEILAEQILPLTLSAAAAPDQADLERELQQLVKKVTDQTNATHDLLLFDPKLKEDLPIYDTLGKDNNELQPKSLHSVLSALSDDQLADLRQWINKPSSTDLSDHPIANRLRKRQKQLRSLVNDDKARLVSMLELSLAMAQRIA